MIRPTLLFLCTTAACLAQDLSGPVTRVYDGDTIEVEIEGERERVRYIGIDTPEMGDERPEVRALAVAARRANARLVEGRTVRLELDVETRDRYGRLLAYVWVGETMVNEALVRSGHASLFTHAPNVRHVERFIGAARHASRQASEGDGTGDRAGDLATIDSSEAAAHVGEMAAVCGTVASTRYLGTGRRPTFLNFGQPYPDQDFTVVIWGENRSKFDEPPERAFADREICVTGEIEEFRSTPQIVVRDPSAIRLVD